MNFKRFMAIVLSCLMICSMVITVNADKHESETETIYDYYDVDDYIKLTYTIHFYSAMNCVRADNVLRYYHNNSSQYNLPSYIKLTVKHSTGENTVEKGIYMMNRVSYNNLEYYIPQNSTLTSATAVYKVNQEVTYEYDSQVTYYANYNYTDADHTLVVTYP